MEETVDAPAPDALEILLVEDDPLVARAYRRVLVGRGYRVTQVTTGAEAARALLAGGFAAVLSDINLPEMDGIALLHTLRACDVRVPVVLVTGSPSLDTAAAAVELGASQYLRKPVDGADLLRAIDRACGRGKRPASRAHADPILERCLDGARMAFQPIVDLAGRKLLGHEALLRTELPPPELFRLGAALGRLHDIGRRVRSLSADAFGERAQGGGSLFVNLHPDELTDPELYDDGAKLSRIAGSVVLEITERSSLDAVPDLEARLASLRALGFRIAVDDLGAGYAALGSIPRLAPEVIKLDMSLVRGVHGCAWKRQGVRSVATLARDMGLLAIAEGVESAAELETVRELGCGGAQGYFLGKPATDFAAPELA
jgi:EAL domain-containing protein (putative c-di-GMP-specific phosphodiesterase class I)